MRANRCTVQMLHWSKFSFLLYCDFGLLLKLAFQQLSLLIRSLLRTLSWRYWGRIHDRGQADRTLRSPDFTHKHRALFVDVPATVPD